MHVIICGGGIIGCSCAYYLSLKGVKCTIIDKDEIGKCPSSKSSGFLARNWGHEEVKGLQKFSFELLTKLCKKWNLSSFREIPTFHVEGSRNKALRAQFTNKVSYLNNYVKRCDLMDPDTAQIDPSELLKKFFNEAISLGCKKQIGYIKNIIVDNNSIVKGVITDEKLLKCDKVVICLGAWSMLSNNWFAKIKLPIKGIINTSIIFKTTLNARAALFCTEDEYGCHLEVFPRQGGDIYVCGCGNYKYISDKKLLNLNSKEIITDFSRVQAAKKSLKKMSSLADSNSIIIQACIQSQTSDGKPIIGILPGYKNVLIATGYKNCSILWSTLTGRSIAELIVDTNTTININSVDPARFK